MKMAKRISGVLFVLLLTFCAFSNVYADSYEYTNEDTGFVLSIMDDAALLSEKDLDHLISDMLPLTEYGNIVFKSITNNATSTANFAREYYHNQYGTASGSLLLMDMYHRIIYLFSDGNNYATITSSKANIITDNIYTYATRGDYYTCASSAFQQMNTLLAGGKIMEPMRYIGSVLVAIVTGFLVNFIIIMIHSRIRSAKAEEMIKNCKIKFQIRSVTAEKIGEHRVYSPQSSDSGSSYSSSGGHFSGGGHSSGGGGGHRF